MDIPIAAGIRSQEIAKRKATTHLVLGWQQPTCFGSEYFGEGNTSFVSVCLMDWHAGRDHTCISAPSVFGWKT